MGVVPNGDGDHITITIDDPNLDAEEIDSEAVLTQLEATVQEVLSVHDCDETQLQVIDGYMRSQLSARCPECDNELRIQDPNIGDHPITVASASCKCGWDGEAVYHLIDFSDEAVNADLYLSYRLH